VHELVGASRFERTASTQPAAHKGRGLRLLGLHYEGTANSAAAREYFEQAEALWSQLVQSAPQFVAFKKNLEWVQKKLAAQ
ncbi:MAG: hypothetical protein AAB354_16290, partial [candidate division KSB1 bacterium]